MDLSQYMDLFLIEAREHLINLNQSLLELESNSQNVGVLDEIFRAAHTLKGMAATMGFEKVADLTHAMENVLSGLRTHEVEVSDTIINLLFQCLDTLQSMIDNVEARGSDDLPVNELVKLLEEATTDNFKVTADAAVSEDPEAVILASFSLELNDFELNIIEQATLSGFNIFHLKVEVDPDSLMKSVRAFMVFRNLEEIGEIVKSVPPAQEIDEGKFEEGFELLLVTREDAAAVNQRINIISEVTLKQCSLFTLEKEGIPKSNTLPEVDTEVNENLPEKHPGEIRFNSKVRQTVRVDIERLDKLMNLVGELVINKTRLGQIGQANNLGELSETVEQFDRILTDLHTIVMKVRMVPVEQVFNRFPRMVRDLAKELGKEINFVIEGKETELDRTVIDEIGDPLVHLLRNSIDHGIEHPNQRRELGKGTVGLLRLSACHEGNNVIIEVEDDGRGIDVERVRAQAIERGLITKETDQLDENTIINMIFLPGFSTAQQITELSGRGVGLDVVRSKIESLSGTISVESKKGLGSRFVIRLPLTLAIIQALLVKVGQETYAVPLAAVDETMAISSANIKLVQNQEVVILRGNVLPIVRMHRLLEVPDYTSDLDVFYVVVVRKGDGQAGLVVDALIGQEEIVIKSLGKLLGGIPGLTGATILGNGQVSLILDVGTLF